MATIIDVAAYILREYGPMTTMKLQKLTFYAQAESISRHGAPCSTRIFRHGVEVLYVLRYTRSTAASS